MTKSERIYLEKTGYKPGIGNISTLVNVFMLRANGIDSWKITKSASVRLKSGIKTKF